MIRKLSISMCIMLLLHCALVLVVCGLVPAPSVQAQTDYAQSDLPTVNPAAADTVTGLQGGVNVNFAWGANLVALKGLTFLDASIIQLTGPGAAAVLTSPGNNYILGSSSDNSALEFKTPANVLSQIGAQPSDTDLTAFAGLACTTDQVPKRTIGGSWVCADDNNSGGLADLDDLPGDVSDNDLIDAAILQIVTPAKGGTGVANGTNNTITFTGNYTFGITLTGNTGVTFPATGILATVSGALGTPSFTLLNLPSSNADPGTTAGNIRHDSSVANHANGAVRWWDGTNIRQMVDMVAATAEACMNGQAVLYNAMTDLFYCGDPTGVPTTITVADEASDTTSFPLFATAATGDLGPKTDTQFKYDPTTGTLEVPALIISGSGGITNTKQSGVAGDMGLYEANSTDTHAAGFRGPASISGDGAYRLMFPNARTSSANMAMVCTNAAESGTGTAADPFIQTCSWLDFDLYAPLADPIFTGVVDIPANATTNAEGEVTIDTTTDQVRFYGSAQKVIPSVQYASFVIPAPADTDDINIMKAPYGMTITGISCIVQGTTSATGQLQECDATGASCADLDSDITCDADGAADDGTLTDPTIANAAWLRWKTTSVSGTPTFLTVTVKYLVVAD